MKKNNMWILWKKIIMKNLFILSNSMILFSWKCWYVNIITFVNKYYVISIISMFLIVIKKKVYLIIIIYMILIFVLIVLKIILKWKR